MIQFPTRIVSRTLSLLLTAGLCLGPVLASELPPGASLPDGQNAGLPLEPLEAGEPSVPDAAAPSDAPPNVALDLEALNRALKYQTLYNYQPDLLSRYLAYGLANPDFFPQDVVARVNMGLDQAPYDSAIPATGVGRIDVLVNQYHGLDRDYEPTLLKLPSMYSTNGGRLAVAAYPWFLRMADDARQAGITLKSVSAYRSASYQDQLYRRYVAKDGRQQAETYSARPGFSEHQTGLAVDINAASRSAHFENTTAYRWLVENSWKYGFILRYPEGKQDITGFTFEPWHYRYLGVELAAQVHESGLTYEEFLAGQAVEPAAYTASLNGLELEAAPVVLDQACWLSAQSMAQPLYLGISDLEESVVLNTPQAAVVVTPGQLTCQWNGQEHTLQGLPFSLDGQLYLSLSDWEELFGLYSQCVDHQYLLAGLAAPGQGMPL